MVRFDELTSLFDTWRNEWIRQYRQHQFLPPKIAKQFQTYIGCPDTFEDPTETGSPIKYVSATRAIWDDRTAQFTLKIYDGFFEDVDFHQDGYFYFGLRVYLEHGPKTFPKESFWFLFRGKQAKDDSFNIWVQRSGKEFILNPDAVGIENLCEHLFDLLKEDLASSPIARMAKEPFRIGFTAN